jgi:hypothetical protein
MTRCHSYCDRPNQADMLHLDLWHGGVNVLRDAGSFSYYTDEEGMQDYFYSTAAHNTVCVDNEDQMKKGPAFLWFNWTRARCLRFCEDEDGAVFTGEHYGYRRLEGQVVHQRDIRRRGDTYTVTDRIIGRGRHRVELRWRLCPACWILRGDTLAGLAGKVDYRLRFEYPEGELRIATGETAEETGSAPEGWESLYYGEKTAVPTVVFTCTAALPIRLRTVIGPAGEEHEEQKGEMGLFEGTAEE